MGRLAQIGADWHDGCSSEVSVAVSVEAITARWTELASMPRGDGQPDQPRTSVHSTVELPFACSSSVAAQALLHCMFVPRLDGGWRSTY